MIFDRKKRSYISIVLCVAVCLGITACGTHKAMDYSGLVEELQEITYGHPGQFGVAVIYDNADTMLFNNSADYPLMSMFKLHEAVAVCHTLDLQSLDLDVPLMVNRCELDLNTWSPMLEDYASESFSVTVGELIDYILVHSDNNASNLLFDSIISVSDTDDYIRSVVQRDDFRILYKESEMKADHAKSYDNCSSPAAYACLVNKLFTESIVSETKQDYVKNSMANCMTGLDRIAAGLPEDVQFAHRTGSGYVNARGDVIAVNDGGYVRLPSGKGYTIVVLVKDFGGSQKDAETLIARISETVYSFIAK